MATYYYNETEKSFAVTTNFTYDKTPKGYKKISKAKYEELQAELNQAGSGEANSSEEEEE